jgi:DNA-binding NarL/FixJ family response regulator
MRASRTVVLAVNPEVMPQVEAMLAAGSMKLSEPIGGKETMRIYAFDAPHLPELTTPAAPTPEEIAKWMGLSHRLFELLQLLGCGLTIKECGKRMGVGEMTAKSHATRLYRRLGVRHGAAEAVAVGYRMGLLTGGES